jgi:hypothetical protein
MATLPLLALALTAVAPQGPPSFAAAAYHPASRYASDLDDGDFNGDGRLDIVVPGRGDPFGPGEVALLLGTPAGFGPKATTHVAGEPVYSLTGDVNNDGKLDCFFHSTAATGVLLGDGLGGLTLGGYVPSPSAPSFGDVNGDGKLDLVGGASGGGLQLNLGDGLGGFAPPVNYAPGIVGRTVLADMDHDGDLDQMVAAASTLYWFSGNGAGSFGLTTSAPISASTPFAVSAGDFDRDGNTDIASSNLGHAVDLVRADGAGTLTFIGSFAVGMSPVGLRLVDVNGDGWDDLVTANAGSENATVRAGDGAGAFAPAVPFALNGGSGMPFHGVNSLDVADLDGDGRLDIACAVYWDAVAAILVNDTSYPIGFVEFGTGTPGCDGTHGINLTRSPQVGASDLVIFSTQAPPSALQLLLLTDIVNVPGSDEFGVGCLVHASVFGATFVQGVDMVSDVHGVARAATPVPNNPILVGFVAYAQSFAYYPSGCPSNPIGLTSSRGGFLIVQP